ncbi:MAG: hypothetical protein ACT4NL_14735 [Pseudomarimonas sp.]
MLSSRSQSEVFAAPIKLEIVRRNLQALLHRLRWSDADASTPLLGASAQPIYDVWIHENELAVATANTILKLSLVEIGKADIIIVLYTGEAGSAADDRDIGICHAELLEAVARRGDVVYIIELAPLVGSSAAAAPLSKRDKAFQTYVNGLGVFRVQVRDEAQLQAAAVALLHQAVAQLVRRGASGGRRRDRGQPLDWGRLDLAQRRRSMRAALATALESDAAESPGTASRILLAGHALSVRIDAIPDALSVAAAREMVGQPFQRDHLLIDTAREDAPGIVHLIACHRGVTETQAKKMLGTSDAMAIASDFGVYAADHVQQIQIFFLAQCADAGAVAIALRRLNEWLAQFGEIQRVVARAKGRQQILRAVHEALQVARSEAFPITDSEQSTKSAAKSRRSQPRKI